MKNTFAFFLSAFLVCSSFAQGVVSLQHAGVSTMYNSNTPLIDAYADAVSGDTIYLAGGNFDVPANFSISIAIIGAGFHPDSTVATLATSFSGNIYINNGADGIYFEGIQLNNSVFRYYNHVVDNITFTRCNIQGNMDFGYGSSVNSNSSYLSIIQCIVIGQVDMDGQDNSFISNSIFQNRVINSYGNTFQNNAFLISSGSSTSSGHVFSYSSNNVIINNVFHTPSNYVLSGNGNIFQYNVFVPSTPILGSSVTEVTNYKNVDLSTVYVNQTGYVFNYTDDFHFLSAAATTYIDANGAEIGIYSGFFPLKEGFVPKNPHISTKNISTATDGNGLLNVDIKVNAQ